MRKINGLLIIIDFLIKMNNKIIRKASVAGSFYPSDKDKLTEDIKNCFINKFGPRSLPISNKKKNQLIGVIVPHAGISYSGPIAAHATYDCLLILLYAFLI